MVGAPDAPMLVVSATRVRTGEARLFVDQEVTADALLASACLPTLFPAVEIDGEPYWDGGYASNPPLRPLIEAGAPSDVILVRTTPFERLEPPSGTGPIGNRVNEIAFSSALRGERRSAHSGQRGCGESCTNRSPPRTPRTCRTISAKPSPRTSCGARRAR